MSNVIGQFFTLLFLQKTLTPSRPCLFSITFFLQYSCTQTQPYALLIISQQYIFSFKLQSVFWSQLTSGQFYVIMYCRQYGLLCSLPHKVDSWYYLPTYCCCVSCRSTSCEYRDAAKSASCSVLYSTQNQRNFFDMPLLEMFLTTQFPSCFRRVV